MKSVLAIFGASLAYATVRYNVFKGVAWSEWPTYVTNKAFGLSAVLLLLLASISQRMGHDARMRIALSAAGIFVLLHVILSLSMLNPAYQPNSFAGAKLTASASWSILLGVAASVGIQFLVRSVGNPGWRVWLGALTLIPGLHAALLGYSNWFEPYKWPGYIVPISLISFIAGLLSMAVAIYPKLMKH